MVEELRENGRQVCPVNNGAAEFPGSDARLLDCEASCQEGSYANEVHICSSLMRGYADILEGNTVPAVAAEARIRAVKGWQ